MKGALLLLLAVGLATALQPGLEYTYRYEARMVTGVLQVARQVSAAGGYADVHIQMHEDHAVVWFSDVHMGEMNERISCDWHAPLPIEHRRLNDDMKVLETPFRIRFNASHYPEYLEAPNEPIMVTNLRKSVVNMFRIAPLYDTTEKVYQLNYGVEEEMLSGHCMNWYTNLKYPAEMADRFTERHEDFMAEDAQRGEHETPFHPKKTVVQGTSDIPLEDDLWYVTRTTDYGSCQDVVEFKLHGNKKSDDVIGRSNFGRYTIRGEKHRRLEKAEVWVDYTVFTNHEETANDAAFDDDDRYGYTNTVKNHERYDRIDSFTNQTLVLREVKEFTQEKTLDYEPVRHESFSYDIEHPKHDDDFLPVEQMLTGRPVTEEIQGEIKAFIKQHIDDMVDAIDHNKVQDGKYEHNLADAYGRIVDAVSNLDYKCLDDLHKELSADVGDDSHELYIFHQTLIYAGTTESVRIMVDLLKNQDYNDFYHIRDEFYDALDVAVMFPKSINNIMDLLVAEPEDETHLFGLMSFASLVHDMCLSEERMYFYYDYNKDTYGHCDQDKIIGELIPYLEKGLNDKSHSTWERLMYLQALSNLGTPHTIEILKPYIMGSYDHDDNGNHDDQTHEEDRMFVRTNAIWSLNRFNMHKTAEYYVYSLLQPIMENYNEHWEMRNMAFVTLSTWAPNLSWWKRVAISTWMDPSPQFQSFVFSTVNTMAHSNTPRNETASRVLHLVKPTGFPSLLHSSNMFLFEYLFNEEMGIHANFAWFAGASGTFPEEIFMRLRNELFYGYQMVEKFDMQQRGFDTLFRMFQELMSDRKEVDSSAKETVDSIFDEAMGKLGFETPTNVPEFRLWAKYDRLIFLANKFSLKDENLFEKISNMEFLKHTMLTFQMPHYFRFLKSFVAMPTEVGLPFTVSYGAHMAYWLKVEGKPSSTGSFSEKMKFHANVVFEASTEAYVEARIHLFAAEYFSSEHQKTEAINAGLYAEREVYLPFTVTAALDLKNYGFELDIEPLRNEKVELYHRHVYPYTSLETNYPCDVYFVEPEFKRVYHDEFEQEPLYKYHGDVLPAEFGLDVQVDREGDEYYYFNFKNFMNEFRTTLHMTQWRHRVWYDPTHSSTKNIHLSFEYNDGRHSLSDELQTVTSKQENIKNPVTGRRVQYISVEAEFQGEETKKYMATLSFVSSMSTDHFERKANLLIQRNDHLTCFNGKFSKPRFNIYRRMPQSEDSMLDNVNYHSEVEIAVYDGDTCTGTPVASVDGSFDVTDESIKYVKDRIDQHCEYNNFFPELDAITTPLYDRAHFDVKWTDDFSDRLTNMTYFLYDTFRGMHYDHINTDYTAHNADHTITINAKRNLHTKHWDFRSEKPHSTSNYHDISTPMVFDIIASPAPADLTFKFDFIDGREPHGCHIDSENVRTFDGAEYHWEPSTCWTTVAMDSTFSKNGGFWIKKEEGEWRIKGLHNKEGLVWEMSAHEFTVNGEKIDDFVNYSFRVFHTEDYHVIVFESTTRVYVFEDKVEVILPGAYRGRTSGICGNYDGERMNEFVGPKGCSYTDYHMFTNSWMTEMQGGCSDYSAQMTDVHEYQNNCPKFHYEATGHTYREGHTDCTLWITDEKLVNDDHASFHCKSLSPVPECKSGCRAKSSHQRKMAYECTHRFSDQPEYLSQEESFLHYYYTDVVDYCIKDY